MDFNESVNYLLSLGNEVLAMKLGLENISKLLAALGNPQNNYQKVQIAGTNGKGSTVAFLEAMCVAAGIKVGATTSPHLVSIRERVRIDGREISEKDFARLATKVRKTAEKLIEAGELETAPTYFEQVTAIALAAFAEAKVELAILETGLGGRYDATTAANAEIAAITPVDYDHQNILGNTLTEIAGEKAAIIRAKNQKVVVAGQSAEAEKVISERCEKFGINPLRTNFELPDVKLGLAGKHQIENAKVAFRLAEILNIENENILQGLQNARHKGRLEFHKGILFDGAHNISGAKALREYLDELINQPITMIFGAMRDKDLTEIAEVLFPKASILILTKPDNPRSMKTAELLKLVPQNFDKSKVYQAESVENALKLAGEISSERNLILVTGSLYLVGEVQSGLGKSASRQHSIQ